MGHFQGARSSQVLVTGPVLRFSAGALFGVILGLALLGAAAFS